MLPLSFRMNPYQQYIETDHQIAIFFQMSILNTFVKS